MASKFDQYRNADGFYPENIAQIVASENPELKALIAGVRGIFILHKRVDDALHWFGKMLLMSGTGREATAGLFYGPSGVGKSSIVEWFVSEYGGVFPIAPGKFVRPILFTSVPPGTTVDGLYERMLAALDAPDLCMGRVSDKEFAVLEQLRLQQVKLVIIDEFNHVIEDRTERATKKFVRAVKHLVSANICQVVLAGTEVIPQIYAQYFQTKRRSAGDMILTVHDWESLKDQEEWRTMMSSISEQLPTKPRLDFGKEAIAGKLHRSSDGLLDNLIKLLVEATTVAYDEGYDELLEIHLWQAFENLRRNDWKASNPWNGGDRRPTKPKLSTKADDEPSNLHSNGRNARNKENF